MDFCGQAVRGGVAISRKSELPGLILIGPTRVGRQLHGEGLSCAVYRMGLARNLTFVSRQATPEVMCLKTGGRVLWRARANIFRVLETKKLFEFCERLRKIPSKLV